MKQRSLAEMPLRHGEEKEAFGDAGFQGTEKRPDATGRVRRNVALRPAKRRVLDKHPHSTVQIEQLEPLEMGILALFSHTFCIRIF